MYETVNLPSGLILCDLLNTEFLLQLLIDAAIVRDEKDVQKMAVTGKKT